MTKRAKQHHTIPCSYLKWFVTEINPDNYRKSIISQYDRKNIISRRVPINSCGVRKNINTLYSPKWTPTDKLEATYWKNQDTWIKCVVDKLNKFEKLDDEHCAFLYWFISSMSHRSEIRIESIKKEVLGWKLDNLINNRTDLELHNMWIKRTTEWLEFFNNNYVLWASLFRAKNLLKFLWESYWYFIHASWNTKFITSDNPVSIFPKENKGDEVFFPITSNFWVFISKNIQYKKLNGSIMKGEEKLIKAMNNMTALGSNRYLYWVKENQFKNLKIPEWLWLDQNPQFYF